MSSPEFPKLLSDQPTPVVILGADALLAALPATAVQLFLACLRAGYQSAVPASWGDELVAEGYLRELEHRDGRPAICCACPLVTARLTGTGTELSNALIPLAAPPVAAARYLRRLAGSTPLHVTYVGTCPFDDGGASATAIDEQIAPHEFLDRLADLGIRLEEMPTTFDDVLPPDRRRHLSIPGGLPTAQAMAERGLPYRVLEVDGADFAAELAEQLMGGEAILLDVAPRLGCACSGAVAGMAPANARAVVMALEPPRSPQPVVDRSVRVDVRVPLPARPTRPEAGPWMESDSAPATMTPHESGSPSAVVGVRTATPRTSNVVSIRPTPPGGWAMTSPGRRKPVGSARHRTGAFPLARSGDGLLLPRAYVARRHSSPVLTPIPATPREWDTAVATATPQGGGMATATERDVGTFVPAATASVGGIATATERVVGTAAAKPSPVGQEFALFLAGLTTVVTQHISPPDQWRQRLDRAIARWWDAGYDTSVLQRARSLSAPPDVEGLLETYAAAIAQLARLEELAASVRPTLRGAPIFRDPRNVAAAESLVDGLLEGSTAGSD